MYINKYFAYVTCNIVKNIYIKLTHILCKIFVNTKACLPKTTSKKKNEKIYLK